MADVVSINKKVRIFLLKVILKSCVHFFPKVRKDATEEQSAA